MTLRCVDDPGADETPLFGGRAASLARLASVGRIPPGFSLSVHAFQCWVDSGSGQMPAELSGEIKRAYTALEKICGAPGVPVAVRSSAVDEDGAGESFAGLHDTYLNVVGAGAVIEAVIKCWRSLGNQHALD